MNRVKNYEYLWYYPSFGREIKSVHIVFFIKIFLIDHLEYTLSGAKSNHFKVDKLFK